MKVFVLVIGLLAAIGWHVGHIRDDVKDIKILLQESRSVNG